MEMSPKQKEAVFADGNNFLVSAGAGSGKTTVLTERVYQLVKKGHSLSKFLILTFTDAASKEMKTRIRKKLLKDPQFAHMAPEIENAHIETFDAFSLFLVKKYAFELNINSDVKVLDETLSNILIRRYIDEEMDKKYLLEDETLLTILNNFGKKDVSYFSNYIFNIIKESNKKLDRNAFFESMYQKFDEKVISSFVDEYYLNVKSNIEDLVDIINGFDNPDDIDKLLNIFSPILNSKNYDELYECLLSCPNLPRSPTGCNYSEMRSYIRESFNKINSVKKGIDFGHKKDIVDSYISNKPFVEFFIEISKAVLNKLDLFKKEHNVYGFSDIARMSISLLHEEKIRKQTSDCFDYIFVDEYQDTSDIQEEAISLIGKNNVYMVGDVKQSIYRFRNANCKIFQDKYVKYKSHDGGEEIDLNTSYRSRKEVVDIVNELFSQLMIPKFNPIDYSDGHNFIFGNLSYNDNIDQKEDYRLKIYTYESEKPNENKIKEINIIAQDIINKINDKYKVFKNGMLQDVSFNDFAIIIDRNTQFDEYKKVFSKYNIPLNIFGKNNLKQSMMFSVLKNILILFYSDLYQHYDDSFNHAFVSVMRSFLMQEKDQTIYQIMNFSTPLESELMKRIHVLTLNNKNISLYSLLQLIIKEFNVYDKLCLVGNYSSNSYNIESLLSLAENMDNLGFSLKDFIDYFQDLLSYDDIKSEIKESESVSNGVTLLNIHQSKGLEYHFCYFPGLNEAFFRDDKTSFLISDKYGLILPSNNEYSSFFNSRYKADEAMLDSQEKLRLLYVALTRAKERIIMICPKELKPVYDLKTYSKFTSIISYLDLLPKYGQEFELSDDIKLNSLEKNDNEINITLETINIPFKKVTQTRASKQLEEKVDSSLLEFGTKLHFLLQNCDFYKKDTSFIKDKQYRKYVDNVLHCGLFDDLTNTKVLHEYQYYDNDDNQGIIDCLLIKENQVIIIDFKLKNIDDEKYVLQLHTYRDYINTITDKEVNMYLISSITGEVKAIE